MGKQIDMQTVAPVWVVTPENEEGDGWMKGFRLYADGAPEIACVTHAQRSGYRDAMNADAACQVIDVMAANGAGDAEFDVFLSSIEDDYDAGDAEFDVFLSSIEDDYEWIRRGC